MPSSTTVTVRISFSTQDYSSNKTIRFKIFDKDGNLIFNEIGVEWHRGVYYIQTNLTFVKNNNDIFLVIAKDVNSNWKSHKTITQNSEFII